jgi:hypothetical protein
MVYRSPGFGVFGPRKALPEHPEKYGGWVTARRADFKKALLGSARYLVYLTDSVYYSP